MAFEVTFSSDATDDIARLDGAVRKRLGVKLKQIAERDSLTSIAKPLSGDLTGFHRIRFGVYRIVIFIGSTQIEVLRVRHRRNVYR
jgi:mRNA-degrading endonuclease RelE of RelBE toxin-antitoxin system